MNRQGSVGAASTNASVGVKAPPTPGESHQLLGTLSRPSNTSYRPSGVLVNKSLAQRQRETEEKNEVMRTMNLALCQQGLPTSQRPPAADPTLAQRLAKAADKLGNWWIEGVWWLIGECPALPAMPSLPALPSLPGLPLPGPMLVGAEPSGRGFTQDLLGEDLVVALRCPLPDDVERPEIFDVERYAKAAASLVGAEHVHIVDGGDCYYRFTKCLAVQTPYAMLMNKPVYGESEQSSINALADFFLQHGHAVDFLELDEHSPRGVDFANLHWSPEHDLLVMAESADVGRMPAIALPRLVKAFGTPQYVLHVAIRLDAVVATATKNPGEPLCYPLNMFFHTLRNRRGQWVALVAEDCVLGVHRLVKHGVERQHSLTQVMQEKGFIVIPLSAKDLEALAACGFSSDLKPGVYLVNQRLPKSLHTRLQQADVQVIVAKPALGNVQAPYGAFGINSVLMQVYGDLSAHEKDDPPTQAVFVADEDAPNERTDL